MSIWYTIIVCYPGLDFLLSNVVQQHPDNAEARKMYEEREKEKRLED